MSWPCARARRLTRPRCARPSSIPAGLQQPPPFSATRPLVPVPDEHDFDFPGTRRPLLPVTAAYMLPIRRANGHIIIQDESLLCGEDCQLHNDVDHDASKLLFVLRLIPGRFLSNISPLDDVTAIGMNMPLQGSDIWSGAMNTSSSELAALSTPSGPASDVLLQICMKKSPLAIHRAPSPRRRLVFY